MSDIKEEVLNVLNVIEESIKLNEPNNEKKINDIEETKKYIVNNLSDEEE